MRRLIWWWRKVTWRNYVSDTSIVFGWPEPPEPGPVIFACTRRCGYRMTGAWSIEQIRPYVMSHFKEHETRKVQR